MSAARLPVKPGPESLVAGARNGARPPDSMLSRPVVATRPPRELKLPWHIEAPKPEIKAAQQRRFVLVPKQTTKELSRPDFGAQTGAERPRPAPPPGFGERRRAVPPGSATQENAGRIESPAKSPIETRVQPWLQPGVQPGASRNAPPQPATPQPATPQQAIPQPATPQRMMREVAPQRAIQERERAVPQPGRSSAAPIVQRAAPAETRQQQRTDLPGKPANRVFRVKEKDGERGDKIEQRRSQQRPDN